MPAVVFDNGWGQLATGIAIVGKVIPLGYARTPQAPRSVQMTLFSANKCPVKVRTSAIAPSAIEIISLVHITISEKTI
jgi:hypothetical protein